MNTAAYAHPEPNTCHVPATTSFSMHVCGNAGNHCVSLFVIDTAMLPGVEAIIGSYIMQSEPAKLKSMRYSEHRSCMVIEQRCEHLELTKTVNFPDQTRRSGTSAWQTGNSLAVDKNRGSLIWRLRLPRSR